MVSNWQLEIVDATVRGAGDYPEVQLRYLLQRLERCEGALPVIADAVRDMERWLTAHAGALEAEGKAPAGAA